MSIHPFAMRQLGYMFGHTARYIRIGLFARLSGYTEEWVRQMIESGKWEHGKQYRVAPDGHAHIDLKGYEEWAEQPLFQKVEKGTTRQRPRAHDVVLYFIQQGEGGPIKIGRSTRERVSGRISTIQTGSPVKLVTLHVADAGPEHEKAVHALLKQHRLHGEWFSASGEVLAFVERCKAVGIADACEEPRKSR